VAVARALVHQPKLLIADEPTANLDRKTGDLVLEVMFDLATTTNTAVVVSSHDPKIIAETDKRQIHLVDGVVISDQAVRHKKIAGL
jgi:ABC-type ATPase involved in cell division